jgi:hypothetical protein
MGAYEKTSNVTKLIDAANRLLEADPNSLRALALLAYLKRQAATSAKPEDMQKTLAEAAKFGERGLQAEQAVTKPDGMSDEDFQKLKSETAGIFNGAVGFAALQNKDYSSAQTHLQDAVNTNPGNLADLYPLAVAYLAGWPSAQVSTPPPTAVQGIWYITRAAAIASDANQKASILKYGRSLYVKYHGSEEGWDQVQKQASASLVAGSSGKIDPAPPADFTIKPRATPAEEAAKMAEKPVKDLGFDEFQYIFLNGAKDVAEKVWGQIKDKPISFEAKVQGATASKLTLLASAEDIEKNKSDVELTMATALTAKNMPKVGSSVQVQGTPTAYTANPFMITMTKGVLLK